MTGEIGLLGISYREIANAKFGNMSKSETAGLAFENILDEFPPLFDCVKPLCRTIRDILFPYENGLFIGTPSDPEKLYGPTIKAFDDAIAEMKAGETEISP